jgi:hypothetical protein
VIARSYCDLMERQNYIPAVKAKACSSCGKPYSPLRDEKCQPCYKRHRRYGSTEYRRTELEDVTVDFVVGKCVKSGDCLLWNGTLSREGRPQTTDRRAWREEGKSRQILLHRWIYEQSSGKSLRKGQQVRQTCGNRICLSPTHLATSEPRPGREPLGEAGKYKGRQKREDHLERCANGHDWTEENLYIDPHGRRICRICQVVSHLRSTGKDVSGHQWRRRKSWEDTPKCVNGHLYEDVGWYWNGEARVCRKCFAEKERKRWLRVNYGLRIEDFEALLVAQGFSCAICAVLFDPGERDLTPCVDHSHVSGQIRGLLCHACNLGLGHFRDDSKRLRAAQDYLATFSPLDSSAGGETGKD